MTYPRLQNYIDTVVDTHEIETFRVVIVMSMRLLLLF